MSHVTMSHTHLDTLHVVTSTPQCHNVTCHNVTMSQVTHPPWYIAVLPDREMCTEADNPPIEVPLIIRNRLSTSFSSTIVHIFGMPDMTHVLYIFIVYYCPTFLCTGLAFRLFKKKKKTKKNKHNTELQRTDPGTKVTGEFSIRGHIFPPFEMNFPYFHRFSWEKIH